MTFFVPMTTLSCITWKGTDHLNPCSS